MSARYYEKAGNDKDSGNGYRDDAGLQGELTEIAAHINDIGTAQWWIGKL